MNFLFFINPTAGKGDMQDSIAERIKEHFKDNMIVLAVVVDKNIRYERLEKRSIRGLNKKEAKERDLSEIVNLKKGGPIAYADLYVDNSKDIPALYKKIDELLEG